MRRYSLSYLSGVAEAFGAILGHLAHGVSAGGSQTLLVYLPQLRVVQQGQQIAQRLQAHPRVRLTAHAQTHEVQRMRSRAGK